MQKVNAQEYAEHDWAALAAAGGGPAGGASSSKKGLNSLTIPTLKVYLQHHGLRMTGNKQELMQRIQEHVAKSTAGK